VKQDSTTKQIHSAVKDGWMHSASFFGSIMAGTLLGYFADMWLGTEPWLVIIGIVGGSYSGFMNFWRWSREVEDVRRQP
jgi:F0F1-type ATP synthase assembly protein I